MRHQGILPRIHTEQRQDMISEKPYLWNFSEDVDFERLAGTGFTDRFRYVPDPLAVHAGQMIISRLA